MAYMRDGEAVSGKAEDILQQMEPVTAREAVEECYKEAQRQILGV